MKTLADLNVGDSLPPMTMEVTEQWLSTDVALSNDPAPLERNPDHFGSVIASPTLSNADFDRFLRANGFSMSGMIPTKTKQEYFGPLHVGDKIQTTCTVIDRSERKGRNYITFEFITSDMTGRMLIRKHDSFLQMPGVQ